MDEVIKVNFLKPMLVLKIRETYKSPYHKNKFLSVKKNICETLTEFKKFMHQFTGNWSSGSYDVQFVLKEGSYSSNTLYSTLVRVDIRDGKISRVWKNSPYTGKEYPLWDVIREFRLKRKEQKNKLLKKKVVKKKSPAKKKVVKKKSPAKGKSKK